MTERDMEDTSTEGAARQEAGGQADDSEISQGGDAPDNEDELQRLTSERDDLYDRLLRKQAELENYRKRVVREKEELRLLVRSEMVRELLLVLDAAEKGLRTLEQEAAVEDLSVYRDGFELVVRQLERLLERYGIEPVPGAGAEFDPRYHEAVAREASGEHSEGTVLEEFRRGYLMGEHLVRPSQVKVAVADSTEPSDGE